MFQFATCDPNRALEFLRRLYPDSEVTRDSARAVLELVEQDAIRIPDPAMHGPNVGILPSKNFESCGKSHAEIRAILGQFHRIHSKGE